MESDFDDDERQPRDDGPTRRQDNQSGIGVIVAILAGVLVLCCGGTIGVGYWLFARGKAEVERAQEAAEAVRTSTDTSIPTASPEQVEADLSRRNLEQIASAIEIYHNTFGHYPNNSYETLPPVKGKAKSSGRPLLSWRVHILPYLEEENLYRQFHLDEPWDSEHNRALLARMPKVYGTPESNRRSGATRTYYRGFSHAGAAFERPRGPGKTGYLRMPASFPDGTSITLVVVEAGDPVEWTRPEDLDWSSGRPRPTLGGVVPSLPYCHCLMADGGVAKVRKDVPEQTLRLLTIRNDQNRIPDNWRHK